jgi:thioredoxin reductase
LVKCENGGSFVSKALLLASDFVARVPDISGVRNYLGHSLHQCPYSDAWEHRGKLIGVIGNDDAALNLALTLLTWSPRVTLYTRGGKLGNSEQIRLQGSPVEVVTGSIRVLEGHGRRLESIRMENGFTYPCDALFYPAAVRSHAKLAERIGGNLSLHALSGGKLPRGSSGIEGLFFTGERQDGLEMAVSAAAAGVAAAEAIDHWLVEAERSYLALPTQHPDRISSW